MATKYSRVFDDCLLPVCAWAGYFAWESILVRALSIYFGIESNTHTFFFIYINFLLYIFLKGITLLGSLLVLVKIWCLILIFVGTFVCGVSTYFLNGTNGSWFWGHNLLGCVFNLTLFSLIVIFLFNLTLLACKL